MAYGLDQPAITLSAADQREHAYLHPHMMDDLSTESDSLAGPGKRNDSWHQRPSIVLPFLIPTLQPSLPDLYHLIARRSSSSGGEIAQGLVRPEVL